MYLLFDGEHGRHKAGVNRNIRLSPFVGKGGIFWYQRDSLYGNQSPSRLAGSPKVGVGVWKARVARVTATNAFCSVDGMA
jgi:hypothetical protein